jgi:hypothetical protein
MGSLITLGIEQLDVDWAKNCLGRNHSCLFLPDDLKEVTYYYAENHREQRPAYARKLRSIKKRLELLGYTLDGCRKRYSELTTHPEFEQRPPFEFETLARGLLSVDVMKFGIADGPSSSDLWKCVVAAIPNDSEVGKTTSNASDSNYESERFFCTLDPYIVLRLLAENPANLDREVAWRFSDLAAGGWVDESCLYEPLPAARRFLLVTEGSSDTNILKKSLGIAEPEASDFFEFVDMAENYPFTGTGNVVRFCEGLAKINIQNRVLVVLDNDTAGCSAAQRLAKLNLPKQIRVMLLPELETCRRIRTLGPSGESFEDVDGRATAIEAFLDVNYDGLPPPTVRWTSYDKQQDAYQGELIAKDDYVRAFFAGAGMTGYDMTSLKYLWQNILSNCSADWG